MKNLFQRYKIQRRLKHNTHQKFRKEPGYRDIFDSNQLYWRWYEAYQYHGY